MDREATLDEFGRTAGESEEDSGGRPPDGDGGHDDAAGTAAAESDDGPATGGDGTTVPITYEWRPAVDCEACGATVDRRWRDGDARVCADCKEW